MAINNNWIYHNFQGFEITDEYSATIGLRVGTGETISFSRDCVVYENFSVDENGVSGDVVTSGAVSGIGSVFMRPSSDSSELSSAFEPRADYNQESFRVAIYMTNVEPASEVDGTVSIPFLLFYREDNDSFIQYYYNTSSQMNLSQSINDSVKVINKNLQNNTEIENTYSLYNMSGNPGGYNITAVWINNGYFKKNILSTNIPIFDTEAHAKSYLRDPDVTEGLLNELNEDPEENYKNSEKYWYVNNRICHNTKVATGYTEFRNYRFYPFSREKLSFYPKKATSASPYTLVLHGANAGYEVYRANTPFANDDDDYQLYAGHVDTNYQDKNLEFASDDFYMCFFKTNIPVFEDEQACEDYDDGLRDITSALNWQDIARIYNDIIRPPYGDEDTGNDNGVNGQSYVQGTRMYVLTSLQLNTFFSDIFDPTLADNILDGLKLFGANQISCIQSLMYLPLDIDDVATVNSSQTPIKIGSWACPNATGRYIQNNNKMIDCGGFNCVRVYNDFRDYEMKIVLQLPYIGFREVKNIADFLDHYISFKYSVDVTTGSCSCHIYADSIEIMCYDGYLASYRPIQAIDQSTYLSNVLGAVTGVVEPMSSSLTGKASAVTSAMTGDIGGAISQGVGSLSTVAIGKTALNTYGLVDTVKDVPMATRGSFAGCLGFFGWQKIHIHTYITKSYKSGTLETIGAPSGVTQLVGMFAGYLSTLYFQIADGFTGTKEELNEIYDVMSQGIYL